MVNWLIGALKRFKDRRGKMSDSSTDVAGFSESVVGWVPTTTLTTQQIEDCSAEKKTT